MTPGKAYITVNTIMDKYGYPVSMMRIPQRAARALEKNGLYFTEQILDRPFSSLLKLPGIGPAMAEEIRKIMLLIEPHRAEIWSYE